MAKRRRRSGGTTTKVVRVAPARQAAPIIRVSAPRAMTRRRRSRRGGLRRSAAHVGGIVSQNNIDNFIGGAMAGYAIKQGWVGKLPSVPVIGRVGLAAILLTKFGGSSPMVRKAAAGFATIAGYQLGHDGTIQGDDDFSASGDDDGAYDSYGE